MVAAVIVEVTTDVAAANSRDTVTDVTCNERAFRLGWGFLSFSGRGGCRDKRPCEKADSGVYVPRAYHATVVLMAMVVMMMMMTMNAAQRVMMTIGPGRTPNHEIEIQVRLLVPLGLGAPENC